MSIGASAKSILAHLTAAYPQDGSYPHDSGDFMRCEVQLEANFGALRGRLHEMAEVNAYWAALVPRWDKIRAASPESQTALIRSIVAPIEKAAPHHIPFGKGVSLRVGPITFNGEASPSKSKKKEEPMAGKGHNSGAKVDTYSVTADELRQFVERAEQMDAEARDVAEQKKELMAEAKGRGYDTKILRKIIALRKRKPDDIAEEEAVTEMYKAALGMNR